MRDDRAFAAFVVFCVAAIVSLIAFGIFFGLHHETKGERISRLEQQVAELQRTCPR